MNLGYAPKNSNKILIRFISLLRHPFQLWPLQRYSMNNVAKMDIFPVSVGFSLAIPKSVSVTRMDYSILKQMLHKTKKTIYPYNFIHFDFFFPRLQSWKNVKNHVVKYGWHSHPRNFCHGPKAFEVHLNF